jgi:hypothetical protein
MKSIAFLLAALCAIRLPACADELMAAFAKDADLGWRSPHVFRPSTHGRRVRPDGE